MTLLGFALTLILPGMALRTAGGQGSVASPSVKADRSVTFTYRDIGATKVMLNLEGQDGVAMTKEASGVWTFTTPPLKPDIYGYSFSADGETRIDTHNPLLKPNLIWQSNMVLVPGTPPEPWEVQDVPHGALHHHFYKSLAVGDERDYFVYTPPGYQRNGRYPVLYLLHGYSDTANGWSEVGKAHVILDNLIAAGRAKPMLVVMTLGYGIPNFSNPSSPNFLSRDNFGKNYSGYKDALLTEVIPAVEKDYSVSKSDKDRAIAGLSMGGAESLYVGLNTPGKFRYIGAFSSGGLGSNFSTEFPVIQKVLGGRSKTKLWISCGTEDGLISFHRNLVKWLTDSHYPFESHETPGRHAWMVWRRNLVDFGTLIFK